MEKVLDRLYEASNADVGCFFHSVVVNKVKGMAEVKVVDIKNRTQF
jgi:hypothetical protein